MRRTAVAMLLSVAALVTGAGIASVPVAAAPLGPSAPAPREVAPDVDIADDAGEAEAEEEAGSEDEVDEVDAAEVAEAADGVGDAAAIESDSAVDGTDEASAEELEAAAAISQRDGITVPAGKNQVAADVLGLGYEQVVRLNGSRVEIVDPVTRGSKVLRSFEAGASSEWPTDLFKHPLFYGGENMTKKLVGHSASRLAVAGKHIYVSNLRTKDFKSNGTWTRKFTVDGVVQNTRYEQAAFAVTSMDGFVWKGKEYVAIGLNYSGVRILDVDRAGMPDRRVMLSHWMGPLRKGGEFTQRDQIIEVKFGVDEHGRFIVVAGAMTQEMPALVALEVETEREIWAKNFRPWQNGWEWPEVIEMGPFGPNGRVSLAVGWPTLGHLEVMDAASGHERKRFTGGVASVVRYFTDASGEPRLAFRRGIGNVWDASLARPDANGVPVVLETVGGPELEWMVPGYRAWTVQVDNRSRSQIQFQTFSGGTKAEGCWLGAGLQGVTNPLPSQPVPIAAGSRTSVYQAGQRHRGDSCAKGDAGVFYLHVEPAGEPSHRKVAKLHATSSAIQIKDQVGAGRLNVQAEPDGDFGTRIVVTDRQPAATFVGTPTIEAARLTPAALPTTPETMDPDDPWRPVHRFTVSGMSWQIPGANADLAEATLPLPVAEGSVDGRSWDALGTVASPLTPTLDGDRLTMGDAVFDWQTAPGAAKDYRYLRVKVGDVTSEAVDRTGLKAPAPSAAVLSIMITGAGSPRANGLDQIPMRVSLRGPWEQALDSVQHAALYDRIYYRDEKTKALITGLGNATEPNQLVMFSLEPGQYSNELLDADASASIPVYFSARQAQGRQITAVFKPDGASKATHVRAVTVAPATSSLLSMGTAANGLSVGSCAESECALKLADPWEAPALHSLTASTVGVQLRTIAVPGSASLPLSQPNRVPEQLPLLSDTFVYHGSRAMLENPGQFAYNGMITTDLVAHGERLVAENHWIRAR